MLPGMRRAAFLLLLLPAGLPGLALAQNAILIQGITGSCAPSQGAILCSVPAPEAGRDLSYAVTLDMGHPAPYARVWIRTMVQRCNDPRPSGPAIIASPGLAVSAGTVTVPANTRDRCVQVVVACGLADGAGDCARATITARSATIRASR